MLEQVDRHHGVEPPLQVQPLERSLVNVVEPERPAHELHRGLAELHAGDLQTGASEEAPEASWCATQLEHGVARGEVGKGAVEIVDRPLGEIGPRACLDAREPKFVRYMVRPVPGAVERRLT